MFTKANDIGDSFMIVNLVNAQTYWNYQRHKWTTKYRKGEYGIFTKKY